MRGTPPKLEGCVGGPVEVVLSGGPEVEAKSIFIVTKYRMASFAKELGCALISAPRCEIIQTDEWKMTSVKGVYAAGDISRMTHSTSFATADGGIAGKGAHHSRVAED